MPDFLDVLAQNAQSTIATGYYEQSNKASAAPISLREAILQSSHVPIITEIKRASPSRGIINNSILTEKVAVAMEKGGAVGLSIITEPKHFQGSLSNFVKARETTNLPTLMKDIILNTLQLDAAKRIGASAILLIQALYDRSYGELSITQMIEEAHSRGLEVLLETHTQEEFQRALLSDAEFVGINNRNLGTLEIDLNVTKTILENVSIHRKIIVSESGINKPEDIHFLSKCGANAFLIGSAVMSADNIESKVREFTMALEQEELKA